MGHRHVFCASQLYDMDNERNWNQPQPDPRLHLENGFFMRPVENPAVGVVNNTSFFNIPPRSDDNLPLSNISLETLNYDAVNAGTSHNPYIHPSAGNPCQIPSHYALYGQPCYNQFSVGSASRTINPQVDYGRVPCKRKNPTSSMTFDNGSSSGYYSAGSSSNIHVSSDHQQPNPMAGWDRGSVSTGPSFRNNNLFIAGEGSQRNVRSRHSHAHPLENNPSGFHACSNLSRHDPVVAEQWSYHTHVALESHRTLSSGSSLSSIENDGGYHSNHMPIRNHNTHFSTLHDPPVRGTGLGHSSRIQRTSYRAPPSYRPMGLAVASEDSRRLAVEAVAPLRFSRPLSIGGRSSDRIGRGTFYGSRNFFDQYHNMRLDIDNMSYEELLALEERIGNVNTGMSEDKISKCLKEVICCYDQSLDEDGGNCIICLEEYKEWDRLGGLNCGHDFHYSCIEKWLQIKDVCPICKASVVKDIEK